MTLVLAFVASEVVPALTTSLADEAGRGLGEGEGLPGGAPGGAPPVHTAGNVCGSTHSGSQCEERRQTQKVNGTQDGHTCQVALRMQCSLRS